MQRLSLAQRYNKRSLFCFVSGKAVKRSGESNDAALEWRTTGRGNVAINGTVVIVESNRDSAGRST